MASANQKSCNNDNNKPEAGLNESNGSENSFEYVSAGAEDVDPGSSENTHLTTNSETMSEAVKQKFAELESKNVELEKKVRTLEYQITHMSLDANKEASALEKLQIQDEGMPIHVPDGLYAIYHVIPGFESTQSINMFQTYGGFPYVTDEKETITAFVQIVNQSKNGKQTVSIRWPVNGYFLSMYQDPSPVGWLRTCFSAANIDDTNGTTFMLFSPPHSDSRKLAQDKSNVNEVGEQFKVCIASTQYGSFVWAEYQQYLGYNVPVPGGIFMLKPSANILRTIKCLVPETNCFIRRAGSNEHLIARQDNYFTFSNSSTIDVFRPIWQDDRGCFCLFLPGRKYFVGIGPSELDPSLLFLTEDETKKAIFWVHRLGADGTVGLRYGYGPSNGIPWTYELVDNCLGAYNTRLMLQFHQ